MNTSLSSNTQAILLLTAPLLIGRSSPSVNSLTPSEYRRLALRLREMRSQPADLLAPDADRVLRACRSIVDVDRMQRLLGRGFLLSQVIERWHSRAIWVVSRADAAYPQRLKSRLKDTAPAVLYGCGNPAILETGGLAVVGSRQVGEALIDYTETVGRLVAQARHTLVSGGARGIDQAAMHGALEAGGKTIGVLANDLEKAAMSHEHRKMLLDQRLVLVSPYDPSAGFNVGNAMQRNKLIYALADAALVVSSDMNQGGTWAGAIEQLDKLHFVPVYVRSTGELGKGLAALRQKGALPWPNPNDPEELLLALRRRPEIRGESAQEELPLIVGQLEPHQETADLALDSVMVVKEPESADPMAIDPAEELFLKASEILRRRLAEPKTETEVSADLGITSKQAREWLKRLAADGVLERLCKPVRYVVKPWKVSPTAVSSRSPPSRRS